jgi:hypothetical protein
MNGPISKLARCAIYTRKSTEYNLELAFNSLDAQREACEAYIKSQAHEGWRLIPGRYDDGAFSGASLDRPALQQLLADVRASKIDIVLVYKVDRLTRSLAGHRLHELADACVVGRRVGGEAAELPVQSNRTQQRGTRDLVVGDVVNKQPRPSAARSEPSWAAPFRTRRIGEPLDSTFP